VIFLKRFTVEKPSVVPCKRAIPLLTAVILAALVIIHPHPAPSWGEVAEQALQPPAPATKIDLLMENAIANGLISGGVVLVGDNETVLFQRAYGRNCSGPDSLPITTETIFDLASLTKVIATAPAILKLAEEGKVSLVAPVTRYLQEFAGKGKDDLLVMNLLTHTSGLNDFPIPSDNPMQSSVEKAAQEKITGEIGSRFHYADINFILLGEMVRRISGLPLDRYAARFFYSPMGMKDTLFNPGNGRISRVATTIGQDNDLLTGIVQDPLARRLGGVAGHSGLFSTAGDLARFCRMILAEGNFEGNQILSERAVRQMVAPYFSRGGKVVRGLGWDMDSPFSAPKGNGFSEVSFGHTGYSGSSIWIDPSKNLYVILLTSRLNYKNTKEFKALRSGLSSLSVEIFRPHAMAGEVEGLH
jgi:CubicO group peptidase (beta-lactamase class C family)